MATACVGRGTSPVNEVVRPRRTMLALTPTEVTGAPLASAGIGPGTYCPPGTRTRSCSPGSLEPPAAQPAARSDVSSSDDERSDDKRSDDERSDDKRSNLGAR